MVLIMKMCNANKTEVTCLGWERWAVTLSLTVSAFGRQCLGWGAAAYDRVCFPLELLCPLLVYVCVGKEWGQTYNRRQSSWMPCCSEDPSKGPQRFQESIGNGVLLMHGSRGRDAPTPACSLPNNVKRVYGVFSGQSYLSFYIGWICI